MHINSDDILSNVEPSSVMMEGYLVNIRWKEVLFFQFRKFHMSFIEEGFLKVLLKTNRKKNTQIIDDCRYDQGQVVNIRFVSDID